MKKIFIIGFVIILLVGGLLVFFNIDKKTDELTLNREKIIKSLGVTNKKRIVVKRLNTEDAASYFVLEISDTGFEQYSYRFYKDKSSYEEGIEKYSSSVYRLEKDDSAYMTKIFAQSGSNNVGESLYDTLIKKYSDTDKYEIVK